MDSKWLSCEKKKKTNALSVTAFIEAVLALNDTLFVISTQYIANVVEELTNNSRSITKTM